MRSLKMIRQLIPSRVCLECQGCCRFARSDTVWSVCLLNEEIKVLLENNIPASLISCDKKIRLIPFQKEDNFTPNPHAGSAFICPFLIPEDNKCKIYNLRPFECQLYPFLIRRQDKKIFLAIDLKCPFVEENLQNQSFKDYTQYLTHLLNSPDWLNILKNNPHIIQEYEETLGLTELKI